MKKMLRSLSIACAVAALAPLGAQAQGSYPSRPIRVIVPYAPGGADLQVRALGPQLSEVLGQQIVVENRDGGGAVVGTLAVKNSPADGYTLLFTGTSALAVVPHMRKNVGYSMDDFVPLGNVTATPLVLAAREGAPFKTVRELLDYARANPGKVNMGSAGPGTTTHMVGEAFQAAAKVRFTHVPFKGVAGAVQGLLGGFSDVVFGVPGVMAPHVTSGKVRILATMDQKRSEFFPDAPSTFESGVQVAEVTKFGIFAPKGTPVAVQQKLTEAIKHAVEDPAFKEQMAKSKTSVLYLGPEALHAAVQAESNTWGTLLKDPRFSGMVAQ